MIERFGVKGTLYGDIFFTEKAIPNANIVQHVRVEISRQNANLSEVKEQLARKAHNLGAAAIMNFRYGQRKHQWWELMLTFKWDTESWHGEGDAVTM